jgi:hypothetical protein
MSKKGKKGKNKKVKTKRSMNAAQEILDGTRKKTRSTYQDKVKFWGRSSRQETMGGWRVSYHHEDNDIETFADSLRTGGKPPAVADPW